ncbi:uncharacterized protein Z518_04494 [Rhinocladiella mackenziei CBS 650.93]|uniref:Zn(2)-C6 fungal-type domain-containing protein n=1 Tax=Rhinocladiella mackenziei CBS 650.93 TaxID=1442369 RepID=A0A0D2H7Z8_9EURO|nr:uncharacterized protein Z518_04494 [Rhinocladiella mackenziei CBS 650.93]KIX06518.1 hypothetical protein Z518_04494 [Rhinocladiella mackenziei CBS 650.93]
MAYTDVVDMHARYGNYSVSNTFASNDLVPDLSESDIPAYSAAFDADPSAKRHAACDECRKRKLKCSGEPTGCERCIKQNLICHFSPQKQMGRPRKRVKIDDFSHKATMTTTTQPHSTSSQSQPPPPPAPEPAIDPELSGNAIERTNFENICNAPITQSIKRSSATARAQSAPESSSFNHSGGGSGVTSQGSSNASPSDAPRTPPDGDVMSSVSYPTDVSLWPDFSDMTMLPMPVQDSHEKDDFSSTDPSITHSHHHASQPVDLDADPSTLTQLPAVPACPCLPNLYLTLSTLSTLSAFPVSSGTIDTLLNAHRTGRSVVYCSVCPQKFQSGSQNVMLGSVLITVLADHWQRVKKATAKELRSGFDTDSSSTADLDSGNISIREDLEWRTFGYNLIRAYVFGDAPIPQVPYTNSLFSSLSNQRPYTLCDLFDAFERRQKQWHGLLPGSTEFPPRLTNDLTRGHTVGMTLKEIKECEAEVRAQGDDGILCLRIVKHSRMLIRSLEGGPPRVEL